MQIRQPTVLRRHGALAVEAAVIMLVFMLLFMGLVEYCRFLWVREICQNAVREGARYAIVNQGDAATVNVQNRAWSAMGGATNNPATTGDTSTLYNVVGLQMRNHLSLAANFQMNSTTNSDIRVYRSDTNGNPQGINLSTGVTTSYAAGNWYQADWTQANFGDLVAVQIVGQYLPISGKLLLMPSSIQVQFTSIMRCEANQ
jgi:Flp pilus assembly protein TadG